MQADVHDRIRRTAEMIAQSAGATAQVALILCLCASRERIFLCCRRSQHNV
jgi:hypothetical protein